jgi:hypothetical protein
MRRPPFPVGGALSLVGLVGALGLVGCGGTDAGPAAPADTTSPPAAAAVTPSRTPAYELPDTCSALLTLGRIDEAIGSVLPGQTTLTRGRAEPAIDRTARLTCGYGVSPATDTASASDPLIELSVFTYTDADAAADRVEATVQAQQDRGARMQRLPVDGVPAVLLTATEGSTLVATVEARTYSLSVVPGVLDSGDAAPALQQLMSHVLAADADADTGAASSASGTGASPSGSTRPTG